MLTKVKNSATSEQGMVRTIIGCLLFGSIWGLSEVVAGGGLRVVKFPYQAGLLTGIGVAIMGTSLAIYRKPAMLIGVGLVTVLVKQLVVPILHVSVMCKANSCLAVLIEAVALSVVAYFLMNAMSQSVHARIGGGALAGLVASVSFYFAGIRVAPCPYLLSFSPMGFIITEGLIWAAFAASLLPLGYLVGMKLEAMAVLSPARRVPLYYATSMAITIFCWGMSAMAIMAGL